MTEHDLAVYIRTHDRATVAFMPWWYAWVRAQLQATAAAVPCDGCGAQCCRRTDVELVEGFDDPAHYVTKADHPRHLARRADGACVYLGADDRCTIHDRRPHICQAFDCRVYAATLTVVLDDDHATLACAAGLTRFHVSFTTPAERAAFLQVKRLIMAHTASGMYADLAIYAALLTWPRAVGGPVLAYLQSLERTAKTKWHPVFHAR